MDKRFSPAVIAAAQAGHSAYRVPASVTLAQWALESRYGEAMPKGSNNPFGIKARPGEAAVTSMTWEVEHGDRVNKTQSFRKFDTLAAAFEAHARLIATARRNGVLIYHAAMARADVPDAFANALTGVYATDPDYGSKPAPAPAAAAPAHPPAAAKAPTMLNLTNLTGLLTMAQAGFALAHEYSAVAPQLASGATELVKDGKDIASGVGELISDIKGKRYGETPQDIEAILGKFGEIVGDVRALVTPAAAIVSKAGSVPSVAAIKALGKAA